MAIHSLQPHMLPGVLTTQGPGKLEVFIVFEGLPSIGPFQTTHPTPVSRPWALDLQGCLSLLESTGLSK